MNNNLIKSLIESKLENAGWEIGEGGKVTAKK